MTTITLTELENNLEKYLELALKEDVILIRDGKAYLKIVSYVNNKIKSLEEISGILPNDFDIRKALWEEKYSKL